MGVVSAILALAEIRASELHLVVPHEGQVHRVVRVENGQAQIQLGTTWQTIDPALIRLEGDLRSSARQVYWSPTYQIYQRTDAEQRSHPAKYRGMVGILHQNAIGMNGMPLESALLRTWPQALKQPGLAVLAWVVDGRVSATRAIPVDPAKSGSRMLLDHAFLLTAGEERGQGVILWWTAEGFIDPANQPADPAVAEARIATLFDDESALRSLFERGVSPNAVVAGTATTLLHYAAEAGSIRVVDVLISARAKLNEKEANGLTALHLAARNGRSDIVQRLLTAKASRTAQGPEKETALLLAAQAGHEEAVRALAISRSDGNVISMRNETPFTVALDRGYASIAAFLVEKGYRHDFKSEQTERVLITQAGRGHTGVVRFLVDRKVRVDRVDRGVTALQAAAEAGDVESLRILIAAGAKLGASEGSSASALALSASRGYVDCVQVLLAAGADPSEVDANGTTTLHLAAIANSPEIVRLLLERGADQERRNAAGMTPFGMALVADSKETVELLWAQGSRLDLSSDKISAALEGVLRGDHALILDQMLKAGLDPRSEPVPGWSMPEIAGVYRATKCDEILRALPVAARSTTANRLARPSDVTARPQLVQAGPPRDPRPVREEYAATTVLVELVIGPDGQALFPRVVDTSDHRLGISTREALRRWRFSPPKAGDQPVAVQVKVPVLFPASRDRVLDVADVDVLPKVIRQVPPEYPMERRRAGVTGQVTVEFVVNTEGQPAEIRVVSSSDPAFDVAAMAAVQKWFFEPGQRKGEAVNVKMIVPIVFSLSQ